MRHPPSRHTPASLQFREQPRGIHGKSLDDPRGDGAVVTGRFAEFTLVEEAAGPEPVHAQPAARGVDDPVLADASALVETELLILVYRLG